MSKYIGGRKNIEFLGRIAQYVRNLFSECYQENPEVEILKRKSRFCQYDRCLDKRGSTDRVIKIRWDNRPIIFEGYAFHSQCLDALLNDERISSLN